MRVPVLVSRMRVARIAAAALMAFALAFAPAKPAKAALSDCAEALSDTKDLAEYLVKQAGAVAGCADKLTFSPPATAAVGVLVALVYAAGEFNDETTCKSLVNSTISKMLAQMLKQSPKVKAALESALNQIPGVEGKAAIEKLINEAGTQAGAALAALPGLDRIFGLMNCTCTVLGTSIETLNRTREIAGDVQQCAGTVGQVIAGSAEYLHCQVFGHCLVPGVQQYQCEPIGVICPPGQEVQACIIAAKLNNPQIPKADWDFCGVAAQCPQPDGSSKPVNFSHPAGSAVFGPDAKYHCPCPQGQGLSLSATSTCVACSGDGKEIVNGACRSWTCPDKGGQKLVSYGTFGLQCQYESTCGWNTVWDSKTNTCALCGANAVFTGSLSSTGAVTGAVCKECAYDEYKPAGSTQMNCMKLHCTGLDHTDKSTPHQCVPCKDVFNPKGLSLGANLNKKYGQKPICMDDIELREPCPPGTTQFPDGCHKPPKALQPILVHIRPFGPGPI